MLPKVGRGVWSAYLMLSVRADPTLLCRSTFRDFWSSDVALEVRTTVSYRRFDAHAGHVFDDGPDRTFALPHERSGDAVCQSFIASGSRTQSRTSLNSPKTNSNRELPKDRRTPPLFSKRRPCGWEDKCPKWNSAHPCTVGTMDHHPRTKVSQRATRGESKMKKSLAMGALLLILFTAGCSTTVVQRPDHPDHSDQADRGSDRSWHSWFRSHQNAVQPGQ
jgi:hypothetical protein